MSQEHIGKHGGWVDYNVSKARLLHSLAKCLLELGQRFARIFCEDLVVMALAIRFLRCHLPVVTGFRSLISSSRAGINFILPTCQVSFYVFDGNYILWYKLLFFLNFILATIGNNWTLFKIVAEMEDRLKPRCGLRSFRYKVVSIQVVSIQIEVVSIQMLSRFDTHLKSIRFKLKSVRYSLYLPKP